MKILNKILLRRNLSTVPTGIYPLGSLRSAAIVLGQSGPCIEQARKFLSENKLEGGVFVIDSSCANKLLGRLKKSVKEEIGNPDLLIVLSRDNSPYLNYMVRTSGAKFKIGLKPSVCDDAYDLVVDNSNDYSDEEIFKKIVEVLKNIK